MQNKRIFGKKIELPLVFFKNGIIINTKTGEFAMAFHRTSPATEPVRRYLLHAVAKSGPEPERLLSERELAQKLRLSRVTVRRAIEELEESHFIIRRPGRKGAFTNPAMSSEVEHTIGVMIYQNYIGRIFSQFLSGLSEELYSMGDHYSMSLIHNKRGICSPEDFAFEIENSGFDCLVWHMQTPEDVAVINLLLKHDFPVLTICNPNFPEWVHPDRNWFGLDTEVRPDTVYCQRRCLDLGRKIARAILGGGCHEAGLSMTCNRMKNHNTTTEQGKRS